MESQPSEFPGYLEALTDKNPRPPRKSQYQWLFNRIISDLQKKQFVIDFRCDLRVGDFLALAKMYVSVGSAKGWPIEIGLTQDAVLMSVLSLTSGFFIIKSYEDWMQTVEQMAPYYQKRVAEWKQTFPQVSKSTSRSKSLEDWKKGVEAAAPFDYINPNTREGSGSKK